MIDITSVEVDIINHKCKAFDRGRGIASVQGSLPSCSL